MSASYRTISFSFEAVRGEYLRRTQRVTQRPAILSMLQMEIYGKPYVRRIYIYIYKSYEMKRTLQPLTQARIQASKEGIAPTNLPPRSRISQDPKRSSQQTTPFYNACRNATKKNTQQHNRF